MTFERCTFCGEAAPLFFRVGDLNRRLGDEAFSYYRCPACRLIFLWPYPTDLGKYYPVNFHTVPTSLTEAEYASRSEHFKLQIVHNFIKTGQLLEIGSGYGGFAYLAKADGFAVNVIEMDTRCCDFLQNIVGVRAINAADPVAALRGMGSFDVIALWQVIEHLPDPWLTLQTLADHLSPNGILILAAPNPDSLQMRLLGKRWPHVDAPRHLSLIPISLIRSLAERLRLEVVSVSTNDPGCLHWNRFGWQVWLANFVSSRWAKQKMSWIGKVVSKLVTPYEECDPHGSTYTVVLQRPA
jgi:2-polyprenyl-3-methyl-5-hydroxy-6-metoxy-1,4-benzoquinol methylase